MTFLWFTRGKTWGLRFLRRAGLADPLPTYERAFEGVEHERETWQRVDDAVALRFEDPLGREDFAGRVIVHDFVIFDPEASGVDSIDSGRNLVWPLVENEFAECWERETGPDPHMTS